MKLSGLHILLTYQCTFACDHCFVWGSPWQQGTLSLGQIRQALQQAQDTGTVTSIYFEGGEPFLYYATLVKGVQEAVEMGFSVGIVSNAYWATSEEDAIVWLRPLAGLISDLSVSSDLFHWSETISQQAKHAGAAAKKLGIPVGTISVAQPDADVDPSTGQIPLGESGVMYRGRAALKLVERAPVRHPWEQFAECPHEDLREPGRVHLDPLGYLHVCQGITIGNLFEIPLDEICENHDPDISPILGALLSGGPAELIRRYNLPHEDTYVDACHLCYEARQLLRERFPVILTPDQVYGEPA